jgi:hypothetical protein
MKTTAVEWLYEQVWITSGEDLPELLEQAKKMEKQQIIDAWYDGQNDHEREVEMYAFGEEYYNAIIKSEKNGK